MRRWATATATTTAKATTLLAALLTAAACKRGGGAPAKPPAQHAHALAASTGGVAPASDATVTIDMANAPPGLVVLIDGAEARIPATVARAPGHAHRVR